MQQVLWHRMVMLALQVVLQQQQRGVCRIAQLRVQQMLWHSMWQLALQVVQQQQLSMFRLLPALRIHH
jgi:hypothetical protein